MWNNLWNKHATDEGTIFAYHDIGVRIPVYTEVCNEIFQCCNEIVAWGVPCYGQQTVAVRLTGT